MGDASVIEASGVKTPDLVREVLWDPRSTDSPASREATAAYIACMTRAGYPGLPDTYEQPEQFRTEDLQRPSEVFAQADGQTVVVRVGAEGAQEVVPVTVGDIVGGFAEVTTPDGAAALRPGDAVVVSGPGLSR